MKFSYPIFYDSYIGDTPVIVSISTSVSHDAVTHSAKEDQVCHGDMI